MKQKLYLLLALLLYVLSVTAQQPSGKIFETYNGMPGIKKKLSELRQSAARINPEDRRKHREELGEKKEKVDFRLDKLKGFKERLQQKRKSQTGFNLNMNQEENSELSRVAAAPMADAAATQEIWSNFLASDFDEAPFSFPPDPNGDVGSSQVAVITNNSLKVFEKRGVTDPPLTTPTGTNKQKAPDQFSISLDQFFFPLFRNSTFYSADPRIHYDRLTKRWFITAIEVNSSLENNFIFLAVSDGERITDETSFIYYRFPSMLFPVNPAIEYLPFLDYPTLGVDRSAVLIGGNDFFFDFNFDVDSIYFVGYVIDKRRLLRGSLTVYTTILGKYDEHNFTYGGMVTPQGVHNGDPQFARSYFAGTSFDLNALPLAAIGYNSNNIPISLTRSEVPVQPWNFPRDITAPGSPMPIDPLDTRLFQATIQKNKRTGKSSLWTAHAIGVNEKGNFVSDAEFVDKARTASRWYEIDNLTTNAPQLIRMGTQYDPNPSGRRATMYFNPSVMANGQGHVVLGGTTAAFDKHLNVFVAGRYYGETPGVLHTPVKATNSTAIYAPIYGLYFGRWGDYSYTVVDPEDDQTIWTIQEYASTDDNYGTRAVQLKAPPPAKPVSITAVSNGAVGTLTNKDDQNVIIAGQSINQSGFFDPGSDPGGPGYKRLSVKSTNGVIVGNIQWRSPTEIRCRVYTKGKSPGDYQLIITNPDGQFVTINYTISAESAARIAATSANPEAASRFVSSSAVFPNPTENNFKLVIDAANEVMTRIVITDISGKQVSTRAMFLGKGTNTVSLSLSAVNKGTYIVAVYNANNAIIAAHRIIKE